jgi:hypothetical protein
VEPDVLAGHVRHRPYGVYPYGNYAEPDNFLIDFLPRGTTISTDRPPKELVLGVQHSGSSKAYPFGVLDETGIANNDTVGDLPVLVTYLASEQTAMAFDRRVNGQELTFAVADPVALTLQDEETGSVWNITGEAISGPLAGERLRQLVDAYVVFWFAWSVYYPNTDLFS